MLLCFLVAMYNFVLLCGYLYKRREHFVRQQSSVARQSNQIAFKLNQSGFTKPIEVRGVLVAQIDSKRFAKRVHIDPAH